MNAKLLKITLPCLFLMLALAFTSAPVGADCGCGGGDPSPIVTVTVSVDIGPSGGGDVDVEGYMPSAYPVSRSLGIGQTISLEAFPAEGYYFVGWSGDLSGSENPADLILAANVEVIAHFFPKELVSGDEMLHIVIPEGTIALDENGELLGGLELGVSHEPLSPPAEGDIISLPYELGPHGTSFDQPVAVNFSYDPSGIPPRVAEEALFIGYYDGELGQWLELPSTVDTVNHIVTTLVSHLSTFAVISPLPPPLPAAFSVSALAISPLEADIGETVIISVLVTNSGEEAGSYVVTLEINGVAEASREITLAGGSRKVAFATSGEEAGVYSVVANGLEGAFTVREAPFLPIALPGAVGWVLVGPALAALVFSSVILPIAFRGRAFF